MALWRHGDAAVVLLTTAGLQVVLALFGAPLSFTIVIDIFLGVQLLRAHHSWKLWALVRAWVGIALAVSRVSRVR